MEETWSTCQYACPISRERLRALRRKRQSAAMTMTGGGQTAPQTHVWALVCSHGRSTPLLEQCVSATKSARCCPGEHGISSGTKTKSGDEAESAAPKNECPGQHSTNQVSANKKTRWMSLQPPGAHLPKKRATRPPSRSPNLFLPPPSLSVTRERSKSRGRLWRDAFGRLLERGSRTAGGKRSENCAGQH